jgi:hypothetical protein
MILRDPDGFHIEIIEDSFIGKYLKYISYFGKSIDQKKQHIYRVIRNLSCSKISI